MRIVFVSRFPKEGIHNPRGGVETATIGLARALLGAGVSDLHIVTLERDIDVPQHESCEGIEVHRLPRSKWPMMVDVYFGPTYQRLNSYLHELKPDLVHFHETWGLGAPRMNLPLVFTVHGFDSMNLPTEKPQGWRLRAALWKWVENIGLNNQRYLISIAPYVTRELEQRTKAKIFDIWNSLDERFFSIKRNEKFAQILFLGWINPRKNAVSLVKAAALLKDKYPELKVEVCGEESDVEYAAELRQVVRETAMDDYVNLNGRLNQNEVADKVASSSMLVLPSLQENAPMVIAECMAGGVPVIGSNLCGIPDMVSDEKDGLLVEPFDIEAIAAAMDKLLGDHSLRQSMSEQAVSSARENFHPEAVASKTLAAYQEVIASYSAS